MLGRFSDAIAAALAIPELIAIPNGRVRRVGPRPARGKTYQPNGLRERTRRTKQAAAIAQKAVDRHRGT